MAEYDTEENWDDLIDHLKFDISRNLSYCLKLIWLCEILLLTLCENSTSAYPHVRNGKYVITHAGCVGALKYSFPDVSTRTLGLILKYRDTVCHCGILKAHLILAEVSPWEVCNLFNSVGRSVSTEELQQYFTLPALRAI